MPLFRERTFAGADGRLRFPLIVRADAATVERTLGVGARWFHILGPLDLGVSSFYGTAREPRFRLIGVPTAPTGLAPVYERVHQLSVDAQLTHEAWLWKVEAITRSGQGERFYSATAGLEYTLSNIANSGVDLGLLGEYSHDTRSGAGDPLEPFAVSVLDGDLFVGGRLALNDGCLRRSLLIGELHPPLAPRYTCAMNAIDGLACATPGCDNRGTRGLNIVGHGSFATKSGRRRRYRCTVCSGTLSTNTGTAYSGLRCTRREFDQVANLRVEGVSISATARVTGHSRNTIARWLERASTAAKCFNDRMLRDFDLIELQADELCTFIGNKSETCWLFATIEVSSRLWAGSVLGHRSDRNARTVITNVIRRGRIVGFPLIATDGFESYVGAVEGLFGSACVYGQVLKTRRNNRVIQVERRVKIGTTNRLKAALLESEDSETLNTSFVERLNLTIRQGSAYLRRRTPCHARCEDHLRGHVELLRCHYNFVRPHRSLKFGRESRTPAMQAGLVSARLALSDIFTAGRVTLHVVLWVVESGAAALPTLSWLPEQRTAA